MNQEYFSVALSSKIKLAVPLDSMGAAIQIETKNISAIPGIAEFWYGAINFKGSLLWVLESDRYFKLNSTPESLSKKATAIIIKRHSGENSARIALVTPKLHGIISISGQQEGIRQLPDNGKSTLQQCCSHVVEQDSEQIFILNPTSLLDQLHQQSVLSPA